MTGKLTAYVKIVLAMSIAGSSVVAGKLLVASFPVFMAAELRFLLAALILTPLLLKLEGFPSLNKREVVILLLQALSGVFLFSIFMLYGLKYTTAVEGGIITSSLPAVVAVLACFTLGEKLSRYTIAGIVLTILGTQVIHLTGTLSEVERGAAPVIGNLFIVGAVIGEAVFIILGKSTANRLSPLAVSTVVSIFGAVLFSPFAIREALTFSFIEVPLQAWLLIGYSGIVVTVIAFILMYQGLKQVPASKAGVLTGALPISTVLLSAMFLKEGISLFHLLGIAAVLTAIYLISKESETEDNRQVQTKSDDMQSSKEQSFQEKRSCVKSQNYF
ncbi:Permease of the drug/metabolite transporter (DMT) superfamily [Evansella caseinilytica]|uniref:Permease of the drug/metabolite transporter (DMT) superfamily n=1 Tax=Evansella caseinilytica TaxID=1503961 RepID=A0A1H3QZA5_9BACI|nr:DMT family transporter [Evansella caseinilytica]SDZ18912.1 Permease of the drug/metabolite transporter (DMT) superfamily [Evansella caseinilytica]